MSPIVCAKVNNAFRKFVFRIVSAWRGNDMEGTKLLCGDPLLKVRGNKTLDQKIVTGAKIFARDLRAHDCKNLTETGNTDWGNKTLRSMFVRAHEVGRIFKGVEARKVRDLGALKCFVKRPCAGTETQLFVDLLNSGEEIRINDPTDDFLACCGKRTRYVGQPVCLLVFDKTTCFLDVQREKDALATVIQLGGWATDPVDGFESISLLKDYAQIFDAPSWPPQDTAENRWTERAYTDKNGKILERSDYEPAIAKQLENNASKILNLVTTTPAVDVSYLEPDSSLGRIVGWKNGQKLVELIVPTQSHYWDYLVLTKHNKIEGYDFKFIPCRLGGGFGGRSSGPLPFYAALSAIAGNGNPVRLEYDRIEQFVAGIKRHPSRVETNILHDEKGELELVETRLLMDGGSVRNLSGSVLGLSAHSSAGAYRSKRRAYRGVALKNSGVLSGSLRGFGIPQALFNIEQQIDRIAVSQKLDPLSYRAQIVLRTGDDDIDGKKIHHPLKTKEVLSVAQASDHWGNRLKRKQDFLSCLENADQRFGTGVAFVMEAYGTSCDTPAVALRMAPDGVLEVDSFAVQMGQGTISGIKSYLRQRFAGMPIRVNAGQAVFLAKVFKLPEEERSIGIDTNAAAKGTFGTLHVLENLIEIWLKHVWASVLEKVWKIPAGIDPEKIEFCKDERVRYPGQESLCSKMVADKISTHDRASIYGLGVFRNTWAYGEFHIASNAPAEPRWLSRLAFGPAAKEPETVVPIEAENVIDPSKAGHFCADDLPTRSLYASAACLVDVVVNGRGHVDLKEVTIVVDTGHRMSERRVKQQIEGGIAQGIGHTLLEEYPSGPLGGQRDLNFDEYALPRVRHMPELGIKTIFVDLDDGEQVLNHVPNRTKLSPKIEPPSRLYKGIAEISISPIAPAIANAIYDALHEEPATAQTERFKKWPITAADVREKMGIAP